MRSTITVINNGFGTVNVYGYDDDTISRAKDRLLQTLYYASRSENVIGGRKGWMLLLDLYYEFNYDGMIEYIKSCHGRCGARRNDLIGLINTIKNA